MSSSHTHKESSTKGVCTLAFHQRKYLQPKESSSLRTLRMNLCLCHKDPLQYQIPHRLPPFHLVMATKP